MLVVGTRGRNPVKGFLLGSISRYCLHHSPIPVVVVRPKKKAQQIQNKGQGHLPAALLSLFGNAARVPGTTRTAPPTTGSSQFSYGYRYQRSGSSSNSMVSSLPGLGLFQSATTAVGETPNKKNSFLGASRSASSSLFASLSTSPQQQPGGFAPGSPLSTASSPASSIRCPSPSTTRLGSHRMEVIASRQRG